MQVADDLAATEWKGTDEATAAKAGVIDTACQGLMPHFCIYLLIFTFYIRRQKEVDALSAAESQRSAKAAQLRQGYAEAALKLLTQQGPVSRNRLVTLAQQLLRLLDGFVMPADLQGSAEDLRDALAQPRTTGNVVLAAPGPPQPDVSR